LFISKTTSISRLPDSDRAHKHTPSRHKTARELEDAELQRAIELSIHELNANRRPGYAPSQPSPSQWGYSEPPIVDRGNYPPSRRPAIADEEEDPDLKAAIEASLREANAPKPSAPLIVETPRAEEPSYSYNSPLIAPPTSQPPLPKIPNYDLEPLETDAILTFNQTVEQVQAQGGRDLSRYPAVNELYEKANGLRPKLALCLDDTGRKEGESQPSYKILETDIISQRCYLTCTRSCRKLSNCMIKYSLNRFLNLVGEHHIPALLILANIINPTNITLLPTDITNGTHRRLQVRSYTSLIQLMQLNPYRIK
jgi:hypothetical protein